MSTRRNYPGSNMQNNDWDNYNQNNNENYGNSNQHRMQNRGYSNPSNQGNQGPYGNRSLYDNRQQGWGGNQYTGQSNYNPQGNYGQQGDSGRYYNSNRNFNEPGYGSRQYGPTNRYSQRERDNDRNFFDRAGETIRAGWNQLTGESHNDRNYNRGSNYGPYDYGMSGYRGNYGNERNDDRNFFERAGDRIREGWHDLTSEWSEDRNRFRQEGRDLDSYSSNRPTNENREYRMGPTSEYDYERNMNRRRYNRNNEWEL